MKKASLKKAIIEYLNGLCNYGFQIVIEDLGGYWYGIKSKFKNEEDIFIIKFFFYEEDNYITMSGEYNDKKLDGEMFHKRGISEDVECDNFELAINEIKELIDKWVSVYKYFPLCSIGRHEPQCDLYHEYIGACETYEENK